MTATKGAATDISQILEAERPDLVVGESMERDLRSTDEDASHHARPEPCPILDLHDRRGDRPHDVHERLLKRDAGLVSCDPPHQTYDTGITIVLSPPEQVCV